MATTQPVASVKVGTRVEIIGKGIVGTVAYIGNTVFSPGKWVGVVLDEPKGKNNGTVQGKTYFACPENYGVFVRQSQVAPLENQEPVKESPPVPVPATPRQSGLKAPSRPVSTPAATPATAKKSGLRPPGTMTKSTESLGETPAPAAPVKQEPDATPASRLSRLPRTSKESTPADDKTSAAAPETTVTAPVRVEHAKVEKVEMTASSDNLAAPSPQASLMNLSQLSAMSSSQSSIDERFSSVQQQQEIEGLKLEVKDLNEKLETLKIKRAEDKVKLKEFEKTKIQLQQLQEYKSRMQESHADLQRQLQASKKELSELQQEYESYKEEMADVTETVEMATLDKEMAEEKAESLQAELDSMKEKVEELTLDLELIRNEISSKGSEGVAATFELKQMEQQNERMKDALVKLRDMLNSEKQDRQRSDKMVEKLESELAVLRKDKERLQAQVTVYEKELIDLKEQVDAALGAEEMVETLTERNLKLEDEIKEILEEKNDLEALNDMNEELQENAKATELELREEVDMKNIKLLEIQRKLDATQETFADYDRTLNKFRELVAHLQEQLRSKQQESETKVETPTAELMDFKTKFAETKAYAKTIDMELRRVDIHQANSHIKMLLSFMPDAFMGRGGDHDAICILLMVPRIMNKAELLASQVKDKYEIADKLEREHVLKSHKAEQFSFANHLNLLLNILYGIMKQYESALNSCSTDLFLKIGTLLPEMTAHEKSVDYFIDLLRKDQLDETVSVDLLEKSISFFQQLYTVHLSHERVDCTHMMSSDVRIVLSACDAIATEITRLKILLLPGEEQSNFSILLKDLETCNNDTRTCARKIKRRLPQEGSAATTPLKFGKDIQDLLTDCCKQISNVAKLLKIVAAGGTQQVALMTGGKLWDLEKLVDKEGLIPKKMEELAQQAAHDIYSKENTDAYESLRLSFGIIVGTMNKLANAMENGEYDFDGTHEKKKPAPLKQRAEAIKSQASDIEAVKLKVDAKEEESKELKRQLRLKQEELSEQQVRIGLVEKKLENKNKEAEEDLSKLQRKLDESALVLKKKEKEFEETYDTLQSDIDSLEQEKTELKERLRVLSKNTLLQNMSRQSSVAVSGSVSPVGGPVSPDSNLLVQQVAALRDALHHSKQELIHLKAERMKKQMASLTPLDVPKKPCSLSSSTGLVKIGDIPDTSSSDLNKLIQRTKDLLQNANKLSACPRLIDISSRMPGCAPATQNSGPMRQIISQTAELTALERNTQELQVQMTTVLASSRSGGQVRTDFSTFPTPQFAKMLHEKTNHNVKLGTIQIPTTGKADIIPLHLQPDQFRYIHEKLIM